MSTILEALTNKYEATTDQYLKIDLLIEITWRLRGLDRPLFFQYSLQILSDSEKCNYTKGIATGKAYVALSEFLGNFDLKRAFQLSTESFEIFNDLDDNSGRATASVIQGTIYWSIGEYDKAFNLSIQALNFIEKTDDTSKQASVYFTLGDFYMQLKDYDRALDYHSKSLKLFEIEHDSLGEVNCITNIGIIHTNTNNLALASVIFDQALEYAIRYGLKGSEARIYSEMGMLFSKQALFDRSLEYLDRSLVMRRDLKNTQGVVTSLINLGEVFNLHGEYEKAIVVLLEGIDISITINAKAKVIRAYQLLAATYKAKEQPWEALRYYELYMESQSSLLGEQNAIQLKNLQSVADTEKAQREAEIERLKNIELEALNNKIKDQNESITDSLLYARRIQEALLPPISEMEPYSEYSFIFYQPKDIVSGDFYWFYEQENRVVIAAVDCTGHGVPGAFMVVIANAILNEIVIEAEIFEPGEILKTLDAKLRKALHFDSSKEKIQDGMDIALIKFDYSKKSLAYAGAKNPLYIVRNNEFIEIKASKHAIGGYMEDKVFTQHNFDIQNGDTFYLSTDGFQDQFGGIYDKKYLKGRFKELLHKISFFPPTQQKDELLKELNHWKGNKSQTDDILVMGINFKM